MKDNYFPLLYTSDLVYVRNKNIIEFDIKSAGYSIAISEGLVEDEKTLEKLKTANREEKQIILGLYAKDNKDFTKKLHKGFQKYIHAFVTLNDISESKIISIKKDSITFFNSNITKTKFKEAIFTNRGEFTSYLRINKISFFVNSRSKQYLIKGIQIPNIKNTLLEEIITIMKMNEFRPKKEIEKYICELREAYVEKNLLETYYKDLSATYGYSLKTSLIGYEMKADLAFEGYLDNGEIDITYNYKNFIMPLCKIFL